MKQGSRTWQEEKIKNAEKVYSVELRGKVSISHTNYTEVPTLLLQVMWPQQVTLPPEATDHYRTVLLMIHTLKGCHEIVRNDPYTTLEAYYLAQNKDLVLTIINFKKKQYHILFCTSKISD